MIERLLIAVALVALGYIGCRLFNLWRVQNASPAARETIEMKRLSFGTPTLVLFTADYCYPCKSQQQPTIQRLLEQIGRDSVQYLQVDVEKEPETAEQWGVLSLPTTFVLDSDGTPREVNHGVTSMEKLKRQLEAVS